MPDGARLYVQNRQIQSLARPDGVSLLPYVQAIRALLVQTGALTLVVEEAEFTIGSGTCARLATDSHYGYRNGGSEPVRFVRATRIVS